MDVEATTVAQALLHAQNAHDLEAFCELFDEAYRSEQPAHPDRAFAGREQVRRNWRGVFSGVADFHAELIASAAVGDTCWAEWHWTGTRPDGSRLDDRGVTLFGIRDGRIAWGRLYMEPVEAAGRGIEAAVERMASGG
jgi:ketosteroid isomerase-like protein